MYGTLYIVDILDCTVNIILYPHALVNLVRRGSHILGELVVTCILIIMF